MHNLDELVNAPSYRLVAAAQAKRLATSDLKVKNEAVRELGRAALKCCQELDIDAGHWEVFDDGE